MKKHNKILLFSALGFALFYGATRYLLGFSIFKLPAALQVSASMGAKLACSGHFITGLSEQQVIDDLASYSPANRLLTIEYDKANKTVSANLKGLAEQSATYRDGLGCTLDIGDTQLLDGLTMQTVADSDAEWPLGNRVSSIVAEKQTLLEEIVRRDNESGKDTRALLLIQDGQLVAEAYGDGFDADTRLLGWSMGKSLTSMMLGRMEYLGLAEFDQATGFSSWQNDARKDLTLIDLLTMSSGLEFDETYAPGSDATNMLFHAHSASDVALTGSPDAEPGQHFNYSSGTTNILSRWIRDRLGGNQQQLDFFHRELLSPLHMSNTLFEVDPSGVFVGSSYIYATGRDWARLGLLMANNGEFNGQRLLSEAYVKAAQQPISADNYRKYGYQFWLNSDQSDTQWEKLPADAYMMMGNRKQVVMIIPSLNTVIVRLGWSSGLYPTEANFAQMLE